MKKFKFIKLLFIFLTFMLLNACATQRPSNYLFLKDYEGLKKRVRENPNFAKRVNCKKNYCPPNSYYSLVDLLALYNFKGEKEDGELLKFLIANGAEVDNKDFMKNYYVNPLELALRSKRNHIAKILIEAGADINNVNSRGDSALSIAIQIKNNDDMIKYLIEKKSRYPYGNKNIISYDNYLTNVNILVNYNIFEFPENNYDYQKSKLSTANVIMGNYLSNLNMELNFLNYDYLRIIHKLILKYKFKTVKKAITSCLNKNKNCISYLNSYTYLGISPIMLAIESDNMELLKFLICSGADINKQNKFGLTALHLAILLNEKNSIKLLLENNAKTNLKDINKNTAISLYKQKFNTALPKYPISNINCPKEEIIENKKPTMNPKTKPKIEIKTKTKNSNNNKQEKIIDLTPQDDVEAPKL